MTLCLIILPYTVPPQPPLCDKIEGPKYKFLLTLILVVFKFKKFPSLSLMSLRLVIAIGANCSKLNSDLSGAVFAVSGKSRV